jgi:hypothetical protein
VGQTLVAVTPGLLTGIVAALGEEIGWRGLLVPQLARLTTFTRTALISGAVQAVWHWPFVLFAGFSSAAPWWFALSILTITVTLAGFSAAWLRLRSGSVWPVVLAHASFNLYIQSAFNPLTRDTGITEYIVDEFGVAFVLSGTVIAYVFWRLRHRLARSPQGDATPVARNDDPQLRTRRCLLPLRLRTAAGRSPVREQRTVSATGTRTPDAPQRRSAERGRPIRNRPDTRGTDGR